MAQTKLTKETLKLDCEAQVQIMDSVFSNNAVETYVVANRGIGLSINACEFRNNDGARSLIGALCTTSFGE